MVEGEQLASELLETLNACPDFQRELITALPDIVDDTSHQVGQMLAEQRLEVGIAHILLLKIIAEALLEMLSSSNNLTVPILDALSNLTLEPDVQNKARRQCLAKIESADVDDLPVVIRFLLQSVPTPEAILEVVKVRRGLQESYPVLLTLDQRCYGS